MFVHTRVCLRVYTCVRARLRASVRVHVRLRASGVCGRVGALASVRASIACMLACARPCVYGLVSKRVCPGGRNTSRQDAQQCPEKDDEAKIKKNANKSLTINEAKTFFCA